MSWNIDGETKVLGILGWPVEHSFSPVMHNSAFSRLGINYVYVPFPVLRENVDKAVAGIRGLGIVGVNVTIPHKNSVLQFLDEVSREAELIGAVNTIVNCNGILKGFNTDAPGFLKALEAEGGISCKGKKCLILGAGGAARAAAVQLGLSGAGEIIFSAQAEGEAETLMGYLRDKIDTVIRCIIWDKEMISGCLADVDILINATPVGMHPRVDEMPPVNFEAANNGLFVYDLIYNPWETMFLREAKKRGLKTLNGMGMLLYQGVIAFELITGVTPPVEVMRTALRGQMLPKC